MKEARATVLFTIAMQVECTVVLLVVNYMAKTLRKIL